MSSLRRRLLQDGWPLFAGVVLFGVSCALMKAPPSLDGDASVDDIYDVGSFDEATGTITQGGTVSGDWEGTCEIYGYPYSVELQLVDYGGSVEGTGTWNLGWGVFDGTVEGTRTADGVQMDLDVDYYGYPMFLSMEATFSEGGTLEGICQYSYGSEGALYLERV